MKTIPASILSATRLACSGVGREHIRAQAERDVVGDLHGLVLRVGLEHHRHRAEQLLAVGRRVGRDAGQHAGREVRAVALAAGDQVGAVGDGTVHLLGQPLGCGGRRQRGQPSATARTFLVNRSTKSS